MRDAPKWWAGEFSQLTGQTWLFACHVGKRIEPAGGGGTKEETIKCLSD